jgi:hypothetical protein
MPRNARYGLIAIALLLLIFWILRSCGKPEQSSVQSEFRPTPQTIMPTTIPTTIPTQQIFGQSVPAPKASVSTGNAKYNGEVVGNLRIDNGRPLTVYAPVYDANNGLVLPDNGLVLWQGYFVGHLIQSTGWLLLETGSVVDWNQANMGEVQFTVGSVTDAAGFNTLIQPLAPGEFKIMTCYIDFTRSTTGNRVFGGNRIFTLTIK